MKYSIDDSGWGHVLLGCIIAVACEDQDAPPFIGEIGVEYFQDPLFLQKKYLEKAYEIVKEAISFFRVGKGDELYCCSGYVLSLAVTKLRKEGYTVRVESHAERKAHLFAEEAFIKRLAEIDAPVDKLLQEDSDRNRAKNFYTLLNWAMESRERKEYLKSGWSYFHPERKKKPFFMSEE